MYYPLNLDDHTVKALVAHRCSLICAPLQRLSRKELRAPNKFPQKWSPSTRFWVREAIKIENGVVRYRATDPDKPHPAGLIDLDAPRWANQSTMAREHCRIYLRPSWSNVKPAALIDDIEAINCGMLTINRWQLFKWFPDYAAEYGDYEEALRQYKPGVMSMRPKPPTAPSPRARFEAWWKATYGADSWGRYAYMLGVIRVREKAEEAASPQHKGEGHAIV